MPLVLSSTKKPLMPCTPKRARLLLEHKKAAVFRIYPFTIILKDRADGETQPLEFKADPGSKTTGITLVLNGKSEKKVVTAINLQHRGQTIKSNLEKRRGVRRGRRNRHTRYRAPRFDNRSRFKGWLPPSLMSRVYNVQTWINRLSKFSPISLCAVETVRFDMQKMESPEISGAEYQQGELLGYEVREYLLEKWNRKCTYCEKENIPLQIEHITPRSKGGSNRVSNLCLACEKCNQKKANKDIKDFLKTKPELLKKIKTHLQKPLKDAAVVNATRYAIGNVVKSIGLPTTFWSGGRTKYNRIQQGYKKDHWIDAACVGESGENVVIPKKLKAKLITATGHGDRQMCLVNKHGFPRSKPSASKYVFGFQTGDIVTAKVTAGKKAGSYIGKVAVRSSGSFNITTKKQTIQGISHKFCKKLHVKDGYNYATI
ncbi:RNA-guided endonuclease IscB [Spirobacillus cienkowskii]|uniref:RNA-guided endonuclease IscB n=1 Tax=Spirobacillus cienkowskii TaxID=495820 RepID=UPI0030D4EFC1